MDTASLNKIIDERIKQFLKTDGFTARKLTDTPTDNLSVVNRKYVNLHGTTASRPTSSVAVIGQRYFDTTIGRPLYFNGTTWVDGAGSVS